MFWIITALIVGLATLAAGLTTREPDVIRRSPRGGSAVTLSARLVLMDRAEDVVTLDCVVASDDDAAEEFGLPAGMPFTVVAELPMSDTWATHATHDALERWAMTGEPLDVAILRNANGTSVRMADAVTRVQLGVAA